MASAGGVSGGRRPACQAAGAGSSPAGLPGGPGGSGLPCKRVAWRPPSPLPRCTCHPCNLTAHVLSSCTPAVRSAHAWLLLESPEPSVGPALGAYVRTQLAPRAPRARNSPRTQLALTSLLSRLLLVTGCRLPARGKPPRPLRRITSGYCQHSMRHDLRIGMWRDAPQPPPHHPPSIPEQRAGLSPASLRSALGRVISVQGSDLACLRRPCPLWEGFSCDLPHALQKKFHSLKEGAGKSRGRGGQPSGGED